MRKFTVMAALVSTALLSLAFFAGCGSDENPQKNSFAQEVVDSVAATVATSLAEAIPETAKRSEMARSDDSVTLVSLIGDMLLVEPNLYAVFDGGVIIYDFEKESYDVIPAFEKLAAVALHEDKVYVGGAGLYTVEDGSLVPVEMEFEGTVTDLYSYGFRLMVGTTAGLYSTGLFGDEQHYADVSVSALAADQSGLWVGTKGSGLYRWDGEEFRRRYLLRDTSIFDNVNTLDFNHGHLYVGTPNGFHIFDGGQWQTLTALDGLPADNVRMIDASGWVIYLATDEGVISFFNGDFMPVNTLEETRANAVCWRGRKVIAATDYEGILVKSGTVLKTLVPADNGMNFNILSLIP